MSLLDTHGSASIRHLPSASFTMLKHLFLPNCWANKSQIVCEASLDRWDEIFFVASGSHDQNSPMPMYGKIPSKILCMYVCPLNLRMNGHRDDWKHCRFERSPVAEHFRSTEHDFLKHTSVCCIDHSPEWTDSTRKSRESYWIRRLNTLRPHGINKND